MKDLSQVKKAEVQKACVLYKHVLIVLVCCVDVFLLDVISYFDVLLCCCPGPC